MGLGEVVARVEEETESVVEAGEEGGGLEGMEVSAVEGTEGRDEVEDAEVVSSRTISGVEDFADSKPRISVRICVYPSTKERLVAVTCCLISLMRTQLLTEVMMEARAADTRDAMIDLSEL